MSSSPLSVNGAATKREATTPVTKAKAKKPTKRKQSTSTKGESKRKKTIRFLDEVKNMLYVHGDVREPYPKTIDLVERIVHEEIVMFAQLVSGHAKGRGAKGIGPEDILFPCRRNQVKLHQLTEYITWKERKKSKDQGEMNELEVKRQQLLAKVDHVVQLNDLTPETPLPRNVEVVSNAHAIKKRQDEMTKPMNQATYKDYSQCRQASFTYQKLRPFREWLGLARYGVSFRVNDDFLEILGYLAWDLVAKIVHTSKLLRGESNESLITHKPILPEHVSEVLRRVKYPQKVMKSFVGGRATRPATQRCLIVLL